MPSPYAPNEDRHALWFEQAVYVSTHIAAVAFGLHMTIYVLSTRHGLRQRKISWGWIAFNTTLFVMGTINLATCIHFNQSAWIDERNYPGGPHAYLVEEQNSAIQTVSNSASVVCSTMAEGLLLYRMHVIWDYRWYITFIPGLFFLACTALSVVTIAQISLPFSKNWVHMPSFGYPVWMMLMVLNSVLTLLIAIRLLYMRRKLQEVLGNTQHGKTYTNIAALVIESALPFGILSIVFLVLFSRKDTTQKLFLGLLVQVECITPMLITFRVIVGSAWSASRMPPAPISTIEFAADTPSSGTQATDSKTHNLPAIHLEHRTERNPEGIPELSRVLVSVV